MKRYFVDIHDPLVSYWVLDHGKVYCKHKMGGQLELARSSNEDNIKVWISLNFIKEVKEEELVLIL